MVGEKLHIGHSSERTGPGIPTSGSFLHWDSASKLQQNAGSMFLMVCMPYLHHAGRLSLLAQQHVI
jgi:hypothetical protein